MVAVEHHHSSGLPYSPYLMAEPLRQWMGHQLPPPSQYHLGAQPLPSAKGFLGPLTISQLECPLGPQPPSTTDDFLRRQTPPFECPLGPLPFSPADDFLRPHISLLECLLCLLLSLPPSQADDFLRPQTPPLECLLYPLVPLPFFAADDFMKSQTPPLECLPVPHKLKITTRTKIPVLSYTNKEHWLLKQFIARHTKTTYCGMSF
uniref:Uncharacterized protein n=1 Tax=Theropithecus gelada TaxID=9565 RepID=A0A8D2G0J0_THEGE